MYPTQALAQFVADFHDAPISQPLLHSAKRAVIDWYAALYPGLATAPVPQLLQVLHEDLGHGAARLATGQRATTRAAALLHGTAAHAAELDDSFKQAMYHPGAATIAAALAQAQAVGANGHEFLRAVIAGYEVSTRIGVVLGRAHYQHWHNTGTVGTFGAAAACASLLKLDAPATAHALATAATFAGGLQQAFRMDSMSKPLHPGKAAESGLLAAQLAARGVTGSLDVLDGSTGFGVALSDGPQWTAVADTLGQDFHITALTFKNHVGCGHTFAAIDAALALREHYALQPEAIEAIHVDTYQPALDIARYLVPQTENEARFSLPFVLATALVHGSVRLGAYTAERLASEPIQRLMASTTVAVDADLDAAFPTNRGARLRITTRDGQQLQWLQSDRKGDPELPLSDAELNGKFTELAAPVLGAEQAAAQLQALWQLEQALQV